MIDRIKKLLQEKGTTDAVFADKINVNRGTISHILNGRNKPSLQVITKILEIYNTINPDWLLFGKQPMYRNDKTHIEPDLFAEKSVNPVRPAPISKETKEIEIKSKEIASGKVVNQESVPQNLIPVFSSKKIDKIMILYSDKTFESFSPD
ncbi:MAG: helix-turn-helix transcriptional regulator [Dysgonamonadaceae bacterium]|jgi:transcriptional regulator with XRE-family HTH domain|nr:helix-turn-helix transcriptional regulator [Dysgonamonadaceae bacterium]